MSFCEYLWDDRANCLLIWVIDPDPIDVVTVEWLNNGEYQTIGVGVPGSPASGGFDIMAVGLPETAGVDPVILTVTGVSSQSDAANPQASDLTERITLDAEAVFANAERKHWTVEATEAGPAIVINDASEKVSENTISAIIASLRYGQTIGPAEDSTGEGKGGNLRLRVIHTGDVEEPCVEVEVFAAEGIPFPETTVDFCTLSATDHVLPALNNGELDLETCSNRASSVLGSHPSQSRRHVFEVPGQEGNQQPLSYLDRVVITTSPPAALTLERSATQSQTAGRSGCMVLVNGQGDYPYVDNGALVDIVLAAQPARSAIGNVDIIRAYGEVGKPMQTSDLEFANEITAATYSEISHAISRRHPTNAAELSPIGIDQFLGAPSYFGVLSALPPERLSMSAPRRLSAAVSAGKEIDVIGVLTSIVLQNEARAQPRLSLWIDKLKDHMAYRAAITPFYPAPLNVVTAGIDPEGIGLRQVGIIAETLDLSKRRQTLDALTAADVLPLSYEHQFISALRDDLEDHIEALSDIVTEVVGFCQSAFDISGLAGDIEFEPRDLLALGTIKPPESGGPENLSKDRAHHWIKADLKSKLGETTISSFKLSVSGLIDRIAGKLYFDNRPDFERISKIVRDFHLTDPIQLEADNVVKLDTSKLHAFAEGPAPFVMSPGHDVIAWLSNLEGDPSLIAGWKTELLKQVENLGLPKDKDSLGA